jgi:hypothetical protein
LRQALESVAGFLREEGQAFHIIDGPITGPAADLLNSYFGEAHGVLPQPVQAWLDEERAAFVPAPGRLRHPLVLQTQGRRLTIQYVRAGQSRELLWLHEQEAVRSCYCSDSDYPHVKRKCCGSWPKASRPRKSR